MSEIWVNQFKVIIMLINMIIKWIDLDQIGIMQIDPKTTYKLNEICWMT